VITVTEVGMLEGDEEVEEVLSRRLELEVEDRGFEVTMTVEDELDVGLTGVTEVDEVGGINVVDDDDDDDELDVSEEVPPVLNTTFCLF